MPITKGFIWNKKKKSVSKFAMLFLLVETLY